MSEHRDYYKVLGVERGADAGAIKSAYRKLARELHPDVNKAPDAQAKFSEIQEAYATLSDDTKRGQYDRFGHADAPRGFGGGGKRAHYSWSNVAGSPGDAGGFDGGDVGSIFEEIFGVRGGGGVGGAGGMGGSPFERAARGGARSRSAPSKGKDLEHHADVDFERAVRGGTLSVKVRRGGVGQTIEVTIPPGTKEGAKLRVRGKGAPSAGGGAAGDLILHLHVLSHEWFWMEGADLMIDVPVSISEAALGARVTVPTLDARVELTVPPGTSSGHRMRIRGHGVPTKSGGAGDLYAVIKVMAPKRLSSADQDLLRGLGDRLDPVREGRPWEE